ncbi:MAG: lytic transglycosylase domain-containing protein [Pseudomonadota bacterium]
MLLIWSGAVFAESPAPLPKFESKRVGIPDGTSGRRITVQIDPSTWPPPLPSEEKDEDAAAPGAVDQSPAPEAPESAYAWFWRNVSPDMTSNSGDRMEAALSILTAAAGTDQDVPAPRADALRRITEEHGATILKASLGTSVSPALVLAVIAVESSGRVDAVSSAGAKGLMQLMPATAERFEVTDLSVGENVRGGTEYLDWLIRHFDGDVVLALAGYNAGEGAVRDHGGVPPYAETRDYVPKVLAAWRIARLLCKTPPAFLQEGCVFEGTLSPS